MKFKEGNYLIFCPGIEIEPEFNCKNGAIILCHNEDSAFPALSVISPPQNIHPVVSWGASFHCAEEFFEVL